MKLRSLLLPLAFLAGCSGIPAIDDATLQDHDEHTKFVITENATGREVEYCKYWQGNCVPGYAIRSSIETSGQAVVRAYASISLQ